MKKIIVFFFILFLFPISCLGLTDTSHSSIVMDINSGRILYQKNSNQEMLIASTTKLMIFLVSIDNIGNRLDEKIKVGDEILKMYGTNMYLSINEELSYRDLLYGLMLRSGNDASVVLAKNTIGNIDYFIELMNSKAKEIGMINTNFNNPHGLDEETKNYSTAYDLAILTRYLYLNYPIYKEIAGSKYYDFQSNLKSYSLVNRCKIIFTYKNITSCKNGYTPKAGKSLVTTASYNNLDLVIVTLDDYDMYENHERFYEYNFNLYKNILILDKDNISIPNIKEKYYLKNNFYYPLKEKEFDDISKKILLNNKGNNLGKIQIYLNDSLIHEEIIYKKNNIKKQENIFQKFVKKLFK